MPPPTVDRQGAARSLARAQRRRRGRSAPSGRPATGVAVQVQLSSRSPPGERRSARSTAARSRTRACYAHTIADEIHQQQRGLRGVARTKLTFSSDRDGERMKGPVGDRDIKEIYIADYDGANQRRVTVTQVAEHHAGLVARRPVDRLHVLPRAAIQDIFVSFIHQGALRRCRPTAARRSRTGCRPGRPTARKIAFTSNRDGNPEIYVMNRDGSGLRRHDEQPGDRRHADLVADRQPDRVHVGPHRQPADLHHERRRHRASSKITSESYCDRPTWSPAPFNEIAYASRTGAGFDIKMYSFANRESARDHRRHRQQREPGVRAQRPAHRVHVDARRQAADLHDRARRQRPAADHARGQQRVSRTGRDRSGASAIASAGATSGRLDAEMRDKRYACCCTRDGDRRGRRVRQEEAAGRAAAAAAAARRPRRAARPPAPPEPVPETTPIPPEPTIADDPLAGKRPRRHQQELAVPAGVLRARQFRGRPAPASRRSTPTPRS